MGRWKNAFVQVRRDILEAAKAMVVARERAEEEAGAEVSNCQLLPFPHILTLVVSPKNCLEFNWLDPPSPIIETPPIIYFLQVGARLARIEAALAKLLARSDLANL